MPIEDHVKFLEMNISRKELYDLVWAEPMTSICTRFGLSVKSSENPYCSTDFCGELQFNIFYGYRDWDTWKEKDTIKDTPNTKIEDKIVSIIANLEVRAEKNKEKRTKWR